MLMVDDFSAVITIERDRCSREIQSPPICIDDNLHATGIRGERGVEIAGGRSHGVAALETHQRSPDRGGRNKWLPPLDAQKRRAAAQRPLGNHFPPTPRPPTLLR